MATRAGVEKAKKLSSISTKSVSISAPHKATKNASILAQFGSSEAKSLNAALPSKSSVVKPAPKKAVNESTELNANSPTTSVQSRGNVILGTNPTALGIKNLTSKNTAPTIANAQRAVIKDIDQEKKDSGYLGFVTSLTNKFASTYYNVDEKLFQGYGIGGPTPKYVSSLRTNKETEAIKNAQIATAQEKIQKAVLDTQTEKQIAEETNLKDLFDTTFLEKLGIGRSAEEKNIQDLIAKNAYYAEQGRQANTVAESFLQSQQATSNPDFQNALTSAPSAQSSFGGLGTLSLVLLGVGAVVLLTK